MFETIISGLLGNFGSTLLEKIFPDKDKRAIAQMELDKTIAEIDYKKLETAFKVEALSSAEVQSQIAVNVEQAKSSDAFVSRPRAMAEWCCIFAFFGSIGLTVTFNILNYYGHAMIPLIILDANILSMVAQLMFGLFGVRFIPTMASAITSMVKGK